ncbi:hypothetical protein EIP86_000324 [Pleurotus ostreatoroseus]|nr:hypothetical protein EIP86_000324 [Pleurotus ostreatoroseus]
MARSDPPPPTMTATMRKSASASAATLESATARGAGAEDDDGEDEKGSGGVVHALRRICVQQRGSQRSVSGYPRASTSLRGGEQSPVPPTHDISRSLRPSPRRPPLSRQPPPRPPSLLSVVAVKRSMLKFWPSSPAADLTPRAGPNGQERINPFDALAAQGPSTPTSTTAPTYHHSLLSTPQHLLSPSISAPTPNDTSPALLPHPPAPLTPGGSATGQPTTSLSLHAPVFNMQQPPPPKRTTTTTTTATASPNATTNHAPHSSARTSATSRTERIGETSAPTTTSSPAPTSSTTTHPTSSHAREPSGLAKAASANGSARTSGSGSGSGSRSGSNAAPTSSSSTSSASPSKGQIHVKLIQARGLNVRSSRARPYVVVQFEQNEFVSRDPTDEADKEVKGIAISRTSSSTALAGANPGPSAISALGAISSRAQARAGSGSRRGSKEHSPGSSAGSAKSGLGTLASGMFGLRISAHNPVWKHEVTFDVTEDDSVITLNVYDRATNDLGFLGTVQIKPVLVNDHTIDHWYKLRPYENEPEKMEPVTGEMRIQITFEANKTKRALTPRDFEFLKLIGRGTFGRVFQVRKKDTKRIYAMKVLSKREIIAKKEVAHTIGERKILQRSLESPFLVGLKFSFQTDTDLYLVTDFKSGGELFWHLQRETRFSEERARFYIAELVLALEHLHKYDIVYRDLKPENILLDATGHVALCDFGLSKPDLRSDELTNTFCGTTEYLAPEVLLDEHGYSKLVDFWSLGVLLFEMCCGWSPFYAEDTQQMYKNICFGKIRFPKGVISEDGKQFVKGLLNRNPKHRLGAQRDAAELKDHAFFRSIDWDALSTKQVTPPFKPVVESDESVANFDPEFTSADMRDAGIEDIMDLDEEDPSEDWVALSQSLSATVHTPNGPLGSDRPRTASSAASPNGAAAVPVAATAAAAGAGTTTTASTGTGTSAGAKGIEMPKSKKKARDPVGSPLTSSVQENFRGFTYHGGESVVPDGAGVLKEQAAREQEEAVRDEEFYPAEEDDDGPVGRYANRRRNGEFDGFDDEMHY